MFVSTSATPGPAVGVPTNGTDGSTREGRGRRLALRSRGCPPPADYFAIGCVFGSAFTISVAADVVAA